MARFAAGALAALLLAALLASSAFAATCPASAESACEVPGEAACPRCSFTCTCDPIEAGDADSQCPSPLSVGDDCGAFDDGCGGEYTCNCPNGSFCDNGKCRADIYAACSVNSDCAYSADGKVVCDNGICKPTKGQRCSNSADSKYAFCGVCVKNCGRNNADEVCTKYGRGSNCEPSVINAKNGGGRFCAGNMVCCAPSSPNYITSTDKLGDDNGLDGDNSETGCDDPLNGQCKCPSALGFASPTYSQGRRL